MIRTPLAALLLASLLLAPGVGAAAGIEVTVTGVEGALRDNVLALLSLQRHSRAPDLDAELVDRLLRRAPREVAAALRPFGYYEPVVETSLRQGRDAWEALISVEPGPPVVLRSHDIVLEGPGRDEPFLQEALARAPLRPGARLSHADYDQLKGELQRSAAANGYLDATFTRAELRVDPAAHSAIAQLRFTTGARYRFGATTIEQDFLRPAFVARYLRYRPGDWYDADSLLRTQFALDDSHYFAVVEVLPEDRDRTALTVPIRIRAEPNRRNLYTVAAGYATDTRARGTLGWENRRLNARGHRLRAELRGSSTEESARLAWVIPWSDPALEKLSLELRGLREERADIETTGGSFRVALAQVQGRWQRSLSLTADATRDEIAVSSEDLTRIESRRSRLLVPGIAYTLLPSGFLGLDAVPRGLHAELLGSATALGSDTNFLRLVLRDERRFRLADRWHLQLRGEAGTSLVGDFQELPAQYRFFAGGDRSVRGYAWEELSPLDANGNRIGGRHLLAMSAELQRDLPRNLVAALFADAGNAVNSFGDPLEYSAGVGLRYRLPFLSIGLDVAQSLSERDRGPRLHLHFAPEF
ncbi:MAG: hypothetical protein EPO25_04595 [Gammaproteobacteria bacterium]|nr:MAG: hypothetical protein EPO25_04595 [Gammaproteobacteria bacterium]